MITLYKKIPREKILETIAKKYADYDIVRFSGFSGDVTEIIHALSAEDLFGNKKLVFLSEIDRELWKDIIAALASISDDTIVLWLEDSFPVALTKGMPRHETVEEKKAPSGGGVSSNPFQIANELSTSNAKQLWATYQELVQEGNAPEAIFGIIWWKLKDIAKRKKALSDQFKKTLKQFLNAYSNARTTGGELETGLERELLQLSKEQLQ
jgi:DNA polymerase III delta subunit